MAGKNADIPRSAVIVAGVIVCAVIARVAGNLGLFSLASGLVRSMLYISLYLGWGISVRQRVIQPQVRRYLSAVSFLMVFWFIVRSGKYYFVSDPNIARLLWYSYYIPMLFIPMLSVFIAMSLGKPENFRLPGWTRLLYIPTALLVLLVLTNDLHQWVFSFPGNAIWTDKNNILQPGYFAAFGWEILCAVTALVTILLKSRQPLPRRYLPGLILLCSVVYALIYISGVRWMRLIAGDITAAQCLMYAGILESCLQTGLIPTNTGYDTLFESASVGMQITDEDYHVCYRSAAARLLPRQTMMCCTDSGSCLWNETMLLKANSINGGYAIWQEDISDLLRVKAELSSAKEELQDRNEILRDQYRKDAQRYRLEEQNRLYDLVQRETQKQLRQIDQLSDRFAQTQQSPAQRKALLLRIVVLATYIKRRKDMLLSSDRRRTVPVSLLSSALGESCSNLSLGGIGGNVYVPRTEELLPAQSAMAAYDFFEEALELSLDTLHYYFVTVSEGDGGKLQLHINLECASGLASLSEKYPDAAVEQDDDGWFLTLALTAGGDRL